MWRAIDSARGCRISGFNTAVTAMLTSTAATNPVGAVTER